MLTSSVFVALSLVALPLSAQAAEERAPDAKGVTRSSAAPREETSAMKIRLKVDGKTMTATLRDSTTTRDFVSLLPLTLTLEDYASTEKIAYLPKKLSTAGAPAGVDPDVGDITYYAPWGNLAIFYRDFGYSTGLVKLGRVDSGIEALVVRGALKVTIESIER
jgi:hypothetical protein